MRLPTVLTCALLTLLARPSQAAEAKAESASFVAVPHVTVKALQEFEKNWGKLTIQSGNDFDSVYAALKHETHVPFLKATSASGDSAAVSALFKAKGFSGKAPAMGPNDIALAGSISIKVQWPEPAGTSTIVLANRGGDKVPGVILPCTHYTSNGLDIASVTASDKTQVFIAIPKEKIIDDNLWLQRHARMLSREKQKVGTYSSVHFPMISLHQSVEHSALLQATVHTLKQDFKVTSATIDATLELDEEGAKAEAEERIVLTPLCATMAKPTHSDTLLIDRDFIIWFERKGVPYFCALIRRDCMKDPGE